MYCGCLDLVLFSMVIKFYYKIATGIQTRVDRA